MMSDFMDSQLNEAWRDALVSYYLTEVVPNDSVLEALGLKGRINTPNDLYQFKLLDVQVSQDVESSPVASTIASLQQYVNGVLMGMEPGYELATLQPNEVIEWHDRQSQYPLWAANQQLAYHPSIYIDPSLRLHKSTYFQQLENDLSQNKIYLDRAQEAVRTYLARFEEVANVQLGHGYLTSDRFADATYYFIGESPAERKFYWRSVDMSQRSYEDLEGNDPGGAKVDYPQPGAWSDWLHADLGISEVTVPGSIRPVFFNNRLMVIWADVVALHETPSTRKVGDGAELVMTPNTRLQLCMSYKKYDDSWSVPRTVIAVTSEAAGFPQGTSLDGVLETIAVEETSGQLFLAMYAGYVSGSNKPDDDGTKGKYEFLKTVLIDKNYNLVPLFPDSGQVRAQGSNVVDGEKEPFVRRVGRLFALTNKGRFQFRASLPISIKSITTGTPHSGTSDWDIERWQKKIATPAQTGDIVYNSVGATLEFRSKIVEGFSGETRIVVNCVLSQTYEVFTLSLVVRESSSILYFELLEGSYIELKRDVSGFFGNENKKYSFDFLFGVDGIFDCLRDSGSSPFISLPKLQDSNTHSLKGKFISLGALLLFQSGVEITAAPRRAATARQGAAKLFSHSLRRNR